jgi:hypothetical protein
MTQTVPRIGRRDRDAIEEDFPEIADLAFLLDSRWRIPGLGLRFGLDAVLGLLPLIGDAAAAGVSAYIIWKAYRFGVPRMMLMQMAGLVAVDAIVGAIPVAGTLFDLIFKANNANVKMLRRYLASRGRTLPPPKIEQQ